MGKIKILTAIISTLLITPLFSSTQIKFKGAAHNWVVPYAYVFNATDHDGNEPGSDKWKAKNVDCSNYTPESLPTVEKKSPAPVGTNFLGKLPQIRLLNLSNANIWLNPDSYKDYACAYLMIKTYNDDEVLSFKIDEGTKSLTKSPVYNLVNLVEQNHKEISITLD